MSDHESEVNPEYPEVESAVTGSFSSNGNDPGAYALASEIEGEERTDGGTFLTDLAKAMQTTAAAEQARDAEITEQRRKAHLDSIRAREAIEAEDLRELAKDDVKGIDAWSDGEIKRIKLERERRIASRREQLQIRLEEHRAVVSREVDAVEVAIATYRTEIERFFFRLGSETDPVEIARQAGTRPAFPALEQIGPDTASAGNAYPVTDYDDARTDGTQDQAVAHQALVEEGAPQDVSYEVTPEPAPEEVVAHEPDLYQATQDDGAPHVESEQVTAEAEQVTAEAEQVTAEAELVTAGAEPEPVAAEADVEPVEGDGRDADVVLVGVMDPGATSQPAESPWQAGEGSTPETEEQPVAEGSTPAEGSAEATSIEGSDEGHDGASTEEHGQEGSEEPVPVAAEAQVVMPRSGGAGSWLRWPNGSSDRPDSGQ
jgi:hypothetical protein